MVEEKQLFQLCDCCGHPQFHTPCGEVCMNGHGGVDYEIGEYPEHLEDVSFMGKNYPEETISGLIYIITTPPDQN